MMKITQKGGEKKRATVKTVIASAQEEMNRSRGVPSETNWDSGKLIMNLLFNPLINTINMYLNKC